MSCILVMGGSNFVSSSLAQYLISRGHEVHILTRGLKPINYTGYKEHLICNRKSEDEMTKTLKDKKYEFIFDISAYTKQDVKILLAAMDKSNLKKYVFCSSGAVYKPSNNIITEEFETGENPNWGQYGLDKKEAEEFIINSSIPYVIFRPTYIYGENNNLYREAYFFHRIKNKQVIPMPCGNNTKTQFIHIEDLLKVLESSIYNEKVYKIYNLTNPEVVSWQHLINTCGEAAGEKPIIKNIDINKINCEARSYFPFRDVTYLLDIKKLIEDGLYAPQISLKEGLERTYSWYAKNKPDLKDNRMDKIEELSIQFLQ